VSGFGYNFSQNPTWQYGVRLGLLSYQEQSEKNSNNGPGNTPTDLSPAVFGNYLVDQHYAVLTSVQTGAGLGKQHDGFLVSLGGRYLDQLNATNRVYGILSTTWASWHYMQDYYGVTQQQATEYNFPEFETQAGMLKIKLALGWTMVINKDWSLITGGSITHPLGDSSSSPLASSKNQVIAYSGVYYKF
jgi:outer membrane scaffolding protein for murein synthesis (MipA/OmpV family)